MPFARQVPSSLPSWSLRSALLAVNVSGYLIKEKIHFAGERCEPRGRKLNCFHQLLRNETRTTADHSIKETQDLHLAAPLPPLCSNLSPAALTKKKSICIILARE